MADCQSDAAIKRGNELGFAKFGVQNLCCPLSCKALSHCGGWKEYFALKRSSFRRFFLLPWLFGRVGKGDRDRICLRGIKRGAMFGVSALVAPLYAVGFARKRPFAASKILFRSYISRKPGV